MRNVTGVTEQGAALSDAPSPRLSTSVHSVLLFLQERLGGGEGRDLSLPQLGKQLELFTL